MVYAGVLKQAIAMAGADDFFNSFCSSCRNQCIEQVAQFLAESRLNPGKKNQANFTNVPIDTPLPGNDSGSGGRCQDLIRVVFAARIEWQQ